MTENEVLVNNQILCFYWTVFEFPSVFWVYDPVKFEASTETGNQKKDELQIDLGLKVVRLSSKFYREY